MKEVVTVEYSNYDREKLIGGVLEVTEDNRILVKNSVNAESFENFHNTIICKRYNFTYVLFDVATNKRIVHKSMINSARYMIKVNTDMLFPFEHHNCFGKYEEIIPYTDPYDYLNHANSFSFSNNFYLDSIGDSFNVHTPNWTELYNSSNILILYKTEREQMHFKVKSNNDFNIDEIIEITKNINYFVAFLRGVCGQITSISLQNLKLETSPEKLTRDLFVSFNFSYENNLFYYLYKTKTKITSKAHFVSMFNHWFKIFSEHTPLFISYFGPYRSSMSSTNFLESIQRLEYLYNNFLRQFETERIDQLQKDLECFYKECNFSDYISDSSFRHEYKNKIDNIHYKIISEVIDHANYQRISLEQILKSIDSNSRLSKLKEDEPRIKELAISNEKSVYLLVQDTRNALAHFDPDREGIIPDSLQTYFTEKLNLIFYDQIMKLIDRG